MLASSVQCLLLGCLMTAVAAHAMAQQGAGIYTCVDAKGRRLTSDRPIVECLDREQQELNRSGTVRRTIGPSLTALERAALEEAQRKAAEERQRQAEERRVQKALLLRYPHQGAHDAERAKALRAVQEVVAHGQGRIAELRQERRKLDVETEFYKDAAQWPHKLRRQIEDIEQLIAAQQRFIAAQDEEKARINKRFDDELALLKSLWVQTASATSGAASGQAPKRP